MKTWNETLEAAAPWVEFLQRDSLFDVPYSGSTDGVMVVTDANIANNFAGAQTDEFDYFQKGAWLYSRIFSCPVQVCNL
jgi:hypothetical protein